MALPNGFKLAPGEHIVRCPYEAAHQVTNLRLSVHLTKCRNFYIKTRKEQGLSVEYVECKFNFLHKILKPELDHHHATCPNQSNVVKFIQYRTSGDYLRKPIGIKQSQSPEKKPLRTVENGNDERDSKPSHPHSNSEEERCPDVGADIAYNGKMIDDHEIRKDHDRNECRNGDYSRSNEQQKRYVEQEKDYGYRREDEDGNFGKDFQDYYEEAEHEDGLVEDYYEENWDEDWDATESKGAGCQTGYDPSVKLKKAAVMYHPMGLTKSERKAFHLSNATKFQVDYMPPPPTVGNPSNQFNPNHPSYVGRKPASKRPKWESY